MQFFVVLRANFKQIGPTAHNWAPNWSYLLLAVQAHRATHGRFYRDQ